MFSGLIFWGSNGLKSKSGRSETPLKIPPLPTGRDFQPRIQPAYAPVYIMYTMLVKGIISSTGLTTVQNKKLQVHNPFLQYRN